MHLISAKAVRSSAGPERSDVATSQSEHHGDAVITGQHRENLHLHLG